MALKRLFFVFFAFRSMCLTFFTFCILLMSYENEGRINFFPNVFLLYNLGGGRDGAFQTLHVFWAFWFGGLLKEYQGFSIVVDIPLPQLFPEFRLLTVHMISLRLPTPNPSCGWLVPEFLCGQETAVAGHREGRFWRNCSLTLVLRVHFLIRKRFVGNCC